MNKIKLTAFILLFLSVLQLHAQDSLYTRHVIATLTSKEYNGRGYVHNGDRKAAEWIRNEFETAGVKALNGNYYQQFEFPVNTFPKPIKVVIDGKQLEAGKDYIVGAGSPAVKGTYKVLYADHLPDYYKADSLKNYLFVVDTLRYKGLKGIIGWKQWRELKVHGKGVVFIQEKLTWTVSKEVDAVPSLYLMRSALSQEAKSITIDVKNKFVKKHKAVNVIATVPGMQTDSFVFVTAHYDHLGEMGQVYFPGANDNASGTAMMLNLMKYYKDHTPAYTIVFVAFAGEEAGLMGSHYYTEHPIIPLNKIKFLLNLDLLATGDEGLMVVNATVFPKQFQLLDSINKAGNYLTEIKQRGTARNSDHYYFTEKGVPSFFCYTLGGVTYYHDIYDRAETLPLTKFKEVFLLITKFIEAL